MRHIILSFIVSCFATGPAFADARVMEDELTKGIPLAITIGILLALIAIVKWALSYLDKLQAASMENEPGENPNATTSATKKQDAPPACGNGDNAN